MKKLLFVILLAGFGWSAWWWIGATGQKSGFTKWFQDRQAEGWLAEAGDIAVRGFPNRFDTTLTNLSLADPDTGLAWDTPFFQLFTLSYQPNHLIAVWPHEQTLSTPEQKLTLTTTDMRASLVVFDRDTLALNRANLAVEGASLTSTEGWQSVADSILLAAHHVPGAEPDTRYRVAVETTGFSPPSLFRTRADPNRRLPDTFGLLKADLTVDFDGPWDRAAIETSRPQPNAIDLSNAEASWGALHLRAAGQITLNDDGLPKGEITIRATNWREIIRLAENSGEVPDALLGAMEAARDLLAGLSGNPKTLDIPLRFKSGKMLIGPVPVSRAPRLILR